MERPKMWSDNETNRDFLNFRIVADTAAEMIVQAQGQPVSLGVCGSWGVGKSSMLELIKAALSERGDGSFLFVDFDAWLYQGYDDARAALMDVIAQSLLKHAEDNKTPTQKVVALLRRVNWLRTAGLILRPAAEMALGLPPTGLIGAGLSLAQKLTQGNVDSDSVDTAVESGKKVAEEAKGLIDSPVETSPPKEIHNLRRQFKEVLEEQKVTLVVFIDDLDRCLPNTAITTLEAIRLFLFLDHTAFIIAADDRMIREAVRTHFKDVSLNDDLVTNYFDKLIQIPIRIPPLGTQDVRAYMMLLFIENSGLSADKREDIRKQICKQLGESWRGKRVDGAFVIPLIEGCSTELRTKLGIADRLAPIMATATKISGNPRLIKRFLNTVFIRMSIAKLQGVTVDEEVLAKLLIFERCAEESAYRELVKAVNEDDEGKARFIKKLEEAVAAGEEYDNPPTGWKSDFVRDWLALAPSFADLDLRPAMYVSREHLPLITPADQMSSESAALLAALLDAKQVLDPLVTQVRQLSNAQSQQIMERLLARARQEQQWGTPQILYGCLTVAAAQQEQGQRLADFLAGIPGQQLTAAIVPLIADKPWGKIVLKKWSTQTGISGPVRNAIDAAAKDSR